MHIEGSLSPSLLFTLAAKNNIKLPRNDAAFSSPSTLNARYENFSGLQDFLDYYYIGMSVLRSAKDYEDLAYEYFVKAHNDGVRHAEVFFDPQAHTVRGVQYETVVAGFTKAQKRAEQDFTLTSKLILCFLRHLPAREADETFAAADSLGHFSDGTVAGVGLDSTEVGFPPQLFREIYAKAEERGLKRTAHGGEEGDPSYISGALDVLHTTRIDHGVRLIEDEKLFQRVAHEKILLTLCPLSNVRLRVVQKVADLPLRKWLDGGIQFSINSDDPAYFGGYILDNYIAVQEAFELTADEWKGIAVASIKGSWCVESRKEQVLKEIDAWFEGAKAAW